MADASEDERRALLRRAAIISLFSWRRADPSDQPDDSDQLGWWGDSFPSVANDQTGSRLYLLRRRTLVEQTLRDAVEYAQEALAWFVEDGHASAVTVTTERRGTSTLAMRAVIDLLNDDPLVLELDDIWSVIHAV
ncbi:MULTISPECIES: phage GP46 family protein [unclassified Herbaspirillum]|uniref:phage GP46 family protein n=1 Tax=unclassified Herbaspirillum TaxID=2624150 RepID=UPI000E2F003D|nr:MULTISPECIES: phage GP46 family protein [unclassified Herbaspirillum]RFB73817.1 hypothetical protein DZB54_05955 [Herbaspirillum sp. 3R-3a1]TFI10372.1 hypothetical protein E4P32_02215 [Herbaspirillum sp. 3R11]TFI16277.1 hypothetical protein E4P31_02220 [Herbaspirillum sp. 3R-11]TFI28374.1 hypothetical protein E4P30_08285 [Herbaspirillum sp. 3C11]